MNIETENRIKALSLLSEADSETWIKGLITEKLNYLRLTDLRKVLDLINNIDSLEVEQ